MPPGLDATGSNDAQSRFSELELSDHAIPGTPGCFSGDPPDTVAEGQAWQGLESMGCLPMPSPHRRAVRMALQKSGLIFP